MIAADKSAFVVVQRAPHEGPGLLGEVLRQRRRPMRLVRRHQGEPLDVDPADLRALVVLGGHEAASDRDAAGDDRELELIARCIDVRVPVLALSSGARLLVRAAGGTVAAGPGAGPMGYVALRRTDAGAGDPLFRSFVDGGACFVTDTASLQLPAGATLLAARGTVPPHAFLVGAGAYGIQWHPELSGRAVVDYAASEQASRHLAEHGADLRALADEAGRRDRFTGGLGAALLGRWVDLAVGRTEAEAPWGRKGPAPAPRPGLSLNPA